MQPQQPAVRALPALPALLPPGQRAAEPEVASQPPLAAQQAFQELAGVEEQLPQALQV